jgi:hypothetical protein
LMLSMQKQIEDEIGRLEVEVILARGKLNCNDFIKETPETTEPSTQTGLQAKRLGEDQKRYPKFYTPTLILSSKTFRFLHIVAFGCRVCNKFILKQIPINYRDNKHAIL